MSVSKIVAAAASGVGGAGLDVDEVFSCHLYEGTGSAQTITNGIDLSGEGGLVWMKARTDGSSHSLQHKTTHYMASNETGGESATTNSISSFNSNGFTLGSYFQVNHSSHDYVSWTFRKAEKFFDVVTYTGNGATSRTISHNLNATVGCIMIKRTDTTSSWGVFHRSLGHTDSTPNFLKLNLTNAAGASTVWDNTAPTSTTFNIDDSSSVNASGGTYVAYLFAHNNNDGEFGPDSDQDIISCGSLTLTSGNVTEEILGWEPQWLLVKKYSAEQNWQLFDNMRGFIAHYDGSNLYSRSITPNTSGIESNLQAAPLSNGFALDANNWGAGDYTYMAIRRGPLAAPEDATKVFDVKAYSGNSPSDNTTVQKLTTGFAGDLALIKAKNATQGQQAFDKLRGSGAVLTPSSTAAEEQFGSVYSGASVAFNNTELVLTGAGTSTGTYNNNQHAFVAWMWKRAPGYFDVVAYTGNSTAGRTVSHNLGVAPEMIWVKARGGSEHWEVYHSALGNTQALRLNTTDAAYGGSWNSTDPTSSEFTVNSSGGVNNSSLNYIAYLFATAPGVSKVGSYTGDGTTGRVIDCGFSSGARFVLIKPTSYGASWSLYDTARGIVSGNDPVLYLNVSNAESTPEDDIDPSNSGFILNHKALGNFLNGSGVSYIFYAIA